MQDGGVLSLGFEGDMDWEAIAQFDLAPRRAHGPLIMQQHRTIGLGAGPFDAVPRLLPKAACSSRDEQT
jgi:hypothetical protein